MKNLILTPILFLCGCAAIQGPANFDNNEYSLINKIYTLSEVYKVQCADSLQTKQNFNHLTELSMELVNYSVDIPDNSDTIKLTIPLNKMISDANLAFTPQGHSITYCKLKLDNIETAAEIIKHAVAQRRRP